MGQGGNITLDNHSDYNRESISWGGFTGGINGISNLCLYADHIWELCEIIVQGYEDTHIGCMLTLISDGEIHKNGKLKWIAIVGNVTRIYSFHINKKASVVVAGYVMNESVIHGRIKITLSGIYR